MHLLETSESAHSAAVGSVGPKIAHNPRIDRALSRERHKVQFEGDTSPNRKREESPKRQAALSRPLINPSFFTPSSSLLRRLGGGVKGPEGRFGARGDLRASPYVYHTASIARDHEEDEGSVLAPRWALPRA